jgi:hypothetical protein
MDRDKKTFNPKPNESKEPVAEPIYQLIFKGYSSLGFFHAGTKTWTHLKLACGQSIMGYFG